MMLAGSLVKKSNDQYAVASGGTRFSLAIFCKGISGVTRSDTFPSTPIKFQVSSNSCFHLLLEFLRAGEVLVRILMAVKI